MPRPAHISRKTAAFGLERLGALGGHARAQRGGAWGMELFAQPGASRFPKLVIGRPRTLKPDPRLGPIGKA
jgi:hypothetical protein